MASGDILAELADRKTLNSTKEDTAAILKTLGNFVGGGTEDTVVEMLQELLTQPKVIKHIQRGYIGSRNGNIVTVPLSGFTNINKMVVICNGFATNANNRNIVCASVNSLAINSLKLTCYNSEGAQYDWVASYQVIEFC